MTIREGDDGRQSVRRSEPADLVAFIDRRLSLKAVLWAFPIAFLIHDSEEVITAERFWRQNRARLPLPAPLEKLVARTQITTGQFAASVGYLFALITIICYGATRALRPGRRMNLLATGIAIFFLNTFTHLGQSLLLRRYTPGVFTAVLVGLPYSAYALRRLLKAKLVRRESLPGLLGIGALVAIPLVASAHIVGWLLFHRRRPLPIV